MSGQACARSEPRTWAPGGMGADGIAGGRMDRPPAGVAGGGADGRHSRRASVFPLV